MADSSNMAQCRRNAIAFSNIHSQMSLTLRWRLVLGHSSDVVATICEYKGWLQFDYEWRLQRNHLDFQRSNAKNCWRSIDAHLWAHLTDIVTVIGCSTIVHKLHTVYFGSQYTVSMYYHSNPKSSRHLSFGATTIHVTFPMNGICPSHFSAFGRQSIACESMHLF